MKETLLSIALALCLALPLAGQEAGETPPGDGTSAPDYSRERLRSIFLEASEEGAESTPDPFKTGIPLFSFEIGDSKTTVRFLPFGALMANETGVELTPIVNPFDMTGSPGSAMSGRTRNRYVEWWISRKLGFPLSPPNERR